MYRLRALLAIMLTAVLLAPSLGAAYAQREHAHRPALTGTLTFFDHGTLSNPTGTALIRKYERLQPGAHIKIVPLPPGDIVPFVNAQLAGGTAADVLDLNTVEQPWNDLRKGWYLDLTPYAQAPGPYAPATHHWLDLSDPADL